MFGLSAREVRFVIVVSSAHMAQHVLMRLIPPLIPILTVALAYPLWQLGILVSLFSFGSGLAQAPLGILSDRFDRRYILPIGIAGGGSGYVLFSQAATFDDLVPSLVVAEHTFTGGFLVMCLAMLIVGIGSAVVHPVGYPMISDNVSIGNKGKALGAFGSAAKFGDAIAPGAVGILIILLVWQRILLIMGVVAIVYGAILYLALRSEEFETRPVGARERDDAASQSASDSRSYLYPLGIIYLFFISKNFAGEGIKTFLPAFIVAVYAYSFELFEFQLAAESVANFYFAALLIIAGIFQLGIGGLTDRLDTRLILLGGIVSSTFGFLGLALLDLGPVMLFLVLCLAGVGIYGLAPARDALISDISPPELEGRTFGYIWTAIMLTGSLMPPTVGWVMEAVGMREGFLVLTAGTVVSAGFVSLLFLDRFYHRPPSPEVEPSVSD